MHLGTTACLRYRSRVVLASAHLEHTRRTATPSSSAPTATAAIWLRRAAPSRHPGLDPGRHLHGRWPSRSSTSARLDGRLRPRSAPRRRPLPRPSSPNARWNSPPTRLNPQTKKPIVRVTIEDAELATAVTYAARSWPSRPPIPVLAGPPVAAENGPLRVNSFAFDRSADTAVTTTVSAPRRDLELDDLFLAVGNCFDRVEISRCKRDSSRWDARLDGPQERPRRANWVSHSTRHSQQRSLSACQQLQVSLIHTLSRTHTRLALTCMILSPLTHFASPGRMCDFV